MANAAFPDQLAGSFSYDYLNPFMAATIVTPSARYPLWTNGAKGEAFNIPTEPGLSNLQALAFLTELVIENNIGDVPRISATLSPPLEDAIKFLDSELVEFGDNTLEVQFGYARGGTKDGTAGPILSNPLTGLLLRPDISLGADASITLRAQGVGGFAAHLQEGGNLYTSTTRHDIIKTICDRQGLAPDFSAFANPADKEADKQMNQEKISYAQGWKTDWATIQDLCQQARCFCVIDGTTTTGSNVQSNLVIIPRASLATQAPVLTLSFFQIPGGILGTNYYPILNANTQVGAIWLPGIRAALLQDIDPLSKLPVTQTITATDVAPAQPTVGPDLGAGGTKANLPEPDPAAQSGYFRRPGAPNNPTAVAQAKAAFEAAKTMMGIPLDIETIGCPTLYPGMVVNVQGLGLRLNGNYGVYKTTHTLGASGFTTSLHLISNTGSFLAKQLQTQNAGPANKQSAGPDAAVTDKQATPS